MGDGGEFRGPIIRGRCTRNRPLRFISIRNSRPPFLAAERGLRAQRGTELLIGDDLQHGIVTQTVSVVGVFVPGHDRIDALPQQGQRA